MDRYRTWFDSSGVKRDHEAAGLQMDAGGKKAVAEMEVMIVHTVYTSL